MKNSNPVWKILASIGAAPYIILILFGLYGMVFGTRYSDIPFEGGRVGFCWNVVALHNQLWPVYLISFPTMLCGLGGWFWEAYTNGKNSERIFLFLLSLGPMVYTIAAAVINSFNNGILYSGLMASPVWGPASVVPWAVSLLWDHWYLHIGAVLLFPLSVSRSGNSE